ncbi:hypothetical protein GCM10007382_22750 [Salinibacterium xinjiangense]|nr:hypothetical protein GCM10007382_22750 [Salinibacterium xinjiangense]
MKLGRAIRARVCLDGQIMPAEFPVVAGAIVSGHLGVDAASAIIHMLAQAAQRHALPERLQVAESALVEAGLTLPADLLAVQARVWRELLDPDGAEPRADVLHTRRAFWIGRDEHGLTRFGGYADPANAALLKAALAERAGPNVAPRFLDVQDAPADAETLTDRRGARPAHPRAETVRRHHGAALSRRAIVGRATRHHAKPHRRGGGDQVE